MTIKAILLSCKIPRIYAFIEGSSSPFLPCNKWRTFRRDTENIDKLALYNVASISFSFLKNNKHNALLRYQDFPCALGQRLWGIH